MISSPINNTGPPASSFNNSVPYPPTPTTSLRPKKKGNSDRYGIGILLTEPKGRDGGLGRVLGALLDLALGLAAARVLVLGELGVSPPLFQRLRLFFVVLAS